MKLYSLITCIVFGLAANSVRAQKDGCLSRPSFGKEARTYTGLYKNPAYGYMTQIPAGLIGLDDNNPDYQKGFTILFPKDNGTLSVYAEANSSLYTEPQAAAKAESKYLTPETSIVSRRYQSFRVASRPAAQSIMLFHCPGVDTSYEVISVFTLNPGNRFLYTLTWQGKKSASASATRAMQALETSWRFITPE